MIIFNSMTKEIICLMAFICLSGCGTDDSNRINTNNPYLNTPLVNLSLNLNLPQYNLLKYPGNYLVLSNQGLKGVVVYNVNNSLYTAFDLADPNHTPSSCSMMTLQGVIAQCACNDNNSYDIVTGQHQNDPQTYPMLAYRITRSGDNLNITN